MSWRVTIQVMSSPKRVALAVALAAVLVTAGCVSGPLTDGEEQQLAETVTAKLDDVDTYEATVTTDVSVGGETTVGVERHVRADAENERTRAETLSPDGQAGDVMVSNESTTWRYDASENTATRYENAGAIAQMGNLTSMFDDVAAEFNVTVNGTEHVAGVEARVVELTPTGRETGAMTAWLNQSTYFPVRVQQEFTADNTTYVTTTTYENVTLNPGFEDEVFEFEPPANATVETETLPETETVESMDALRDAANQSVASVDVPTDFAFEKGTVVTDDGNETVAASYANDTATVRVTQRVGTTYTPSGESVTVDGRNATLSSYGDTVVVSWTCEETSYIVTSDVDESLTRSVAASVDC